jgi:hypothetical protein
MILPDLGEFLITNREELILRCRTRAATIPGWPSSRAVLERGIPLFLTQLIQELRHDSSQTAVMRKTAIEHGRDLFLQGFSVSQVVHDYGNVCQCVCDLALERAFPIDTDDFRTLNRCLDDAIAGAAEEYVRHQPFRITSHPEELRTLVDSAIVAFESCQSGSAETGAAPDAFVRRTLLEIRALVNASYYRCLTSSYVALPSPKSDR